MCGQKPGGSASVSFAVQSLCQALRSPIPGQRRGSGSTTVPGSGWGRPPACCSPASPPHLTASGRKTRAPAHSQQEGNSALAGPGHSAPATPQAARGRGRRQGPRPAEHPPSMCPTPRWASWRRCRARRGWPWLPHSNTRHKRLPTQQCRRVPLNSHRGLAERPPAIGALLG